MRALVLTASAVLAGCASMPADYVSPLVYDTYNCYQLRAEHARLYAMERNAVAPGPILAWRDPSTIAQARAQLNAVEAAAAAKGCAGVIAPPL